MPLVGPWEIALILIVVVLLFGGKKLPELARSVGEAIRQYRSATESTEKTPKEETLSQSEEETLLQTAKKLGIKTKGKTPKEISEEILKKAK
ncbi:Sec-independent protein translocase subunit TatA/TatB [[Eubacterium] cellulosolvens]